MTELLLVIIAIGVLLMSNEGKAILSGAIGLAWLAFIGIIILAIGGGAYVGLTDANAPQWTHFIAQTAIAVGVFSGIAVIWLLWEFIWNGIKAKYPPLNALMKKLHSVLDQLYIWFISAIISCAVGGIALIFPYAATKETWVAVFVGVIAGLPAFYFTARLMAKKARARRQAVEHGNLG